MTFNAVASACTMHTCVQPHASYFPRIATNTKSLTPTSLLRTTVEMSTRVVAQRSHSDDRVVARDHFPAAIYHESLALLLLCGPLRAESILGSIAELARCLLSFYSPALVSHHGLDEHGVPAN